MSCKRLDVLTWERGEVVFLEKVIYTHAEQFGNETNVIPVVEPRKQVNAFAAKRMSTGCYPGQPRATLTVG